MNELDRYFGNRLRTAEIKARSIKGGISTLASQGGKFIVQIASTALLARMLTPADFGLIAMVTALTGFVAMFKDMGLSTATIQKEEINHAQVSMLFWVNSAVGAGLTILTLTMSSGIAWFYGDARLTGIAVVIAMTFVFSGVSAQHQALLRRQMMFGVLAVIEIAGVLGGAVLAIFAAWQGAGYWSLVIMQLATEVFISAGVWLSCKWRPSWPSKHSGVKSMLAFGRNLTGFNLVNHLARNLDNLLIGKYWGPKSLGEYSRAYSLLMLPIHQINGPISSVAIPALSRLQQEPDQFKIYYLRMLYFMSLISVPVVAIMISFSETLIMIILGDQWVDASKIFKVLGIAALIQPILSTSGWLHIAMGRSDRMLRWGVFASAIAVLSFIVGLPFGAIGVAVCYTCACFLLAYPCLWYASKSTPIDVSSIVKTLWPIACSVAVLGVAMMVFRVCFPDFYSGWMGLLIGSAMSMSLFFASLCCIAQSLHPIREVLDLFKVFLMKGPVST